MYTTLDEIKSRMPQGHLVEALDDDNDGMIDEGLADTVLGDASNAVDSILGQRFSTPFVAPYPAIVIDAARTFALELLYMRRGFHSEDDNPWRSRADAMRKKLDRIATSDEPLAPSQKGNSGSVQIISEPSRTTSSFGNLST